MSIPHSDAVLIGAGIMSATLGAFFKQLAPEKSLAVLEKLSAPALENSFELNNAGTGHAALCELNYTPQRPDGSVETERAAEINEKFLVSLQMWAYLSKQGLMGDPAAFIRRLPHISFVSGEKDVSFLKARYEALSRHPLFAGMEFAEDEATLRQWLPLMMQNRAAGTPLAATRIAYGTDVNFGAITRRLFDYLAAQDTAFHFNSTVTDIRRTADGKWLIAYEQNGTPRRHTADFVFIGAGGGSLHLLQKSDIPESKGVGGFPVSGLFLMCRNAELIRQHHGKVYGKAKVGAPPMSVPHLDTRYIDGEKALLFGPFAGFSPKFLKQGSYCDLLSSVKSHNVLAMLCSAAKNTSLTKYLLQQVVLTKEERMAELREFIPDARAEDWDVVVAGQRVQIIKDTATERGVLRFGTEIIHSQDGSLAALLGASPGASIFVSAMLELLQKCFPQCHDEWAEKLQAMIPSYGLKLAEHPELLRQVRAEIDAALGFAE